MKIHADTLPKTTANLIEKINSLPEIQAFYLSGGTALALQLGHRESEDLDFFNQREFDPNHIQQTLLNIGPLESIQIEKGTFNAFLHGVKLQFLHYPYTLLKKTLPWNKLNLSSVIDIACTKLITISARGNKKDFIDIYHILKKYSIQELFSKLDRKYKETNYNYAHILKSLIYFQDADAQPMPRMHVKTNWQQIKQEIILQVKEFRF